MRKIIRWIAEKFLPVWAREELMKENKALRAENERLAVRVKLLEAYIDGYASGVKTHRRIVINTGEVKK